MSITVTAQTLNRMATERMEQLDGEIARLEAALTSAQQEWKDLYAIRMAYEGTLDLVTNEDVPAPHEEMDF